MLRLSRQTRIFQVSPTLIHQRISFRQYNDKSTTDGIGHDDKPNDTASASVKPREEWAGGSSLWVSLATVLTW